MRRFPFILMLLIGLASSSALAIEPATAPFASTDVGNISDAALRELTNKDLLQLYQSTALRAGATDVMPDQGNPSDWDPNVHRIRDEILRRGAPMSPLLASAFRTESTLHRPEVPGKYPPGLLSSEAQLLIDLGDPSAVPTLLDVAAHGPPQRENSLFGPQLTAINMLECLTFVLFHRASPSEDNYSSAVEHPNALPVDDFSPDDYPKVARLYQDWLAGEGKDPAQWHSLAQKRARKLLESEDPNAAYCAASFLAGSTPRGLESISNDDDPGRTMPRLARFISESRHLPGNDPYAYEYRNKPTHVSIADWLALLARYGPRARPHAAVVIRVQKDNKLTDWWTIEQMSRIGGADIMARCVEILPAISEQADKILNDPAQPKGYDSHDPRLGWIEAQLQCRCCIDRWAGRTFDSDEQRLTWWDANRQKSPQQWLEDSLTIAAQRADAHAGEELLHDGWLFWQLLPDAPFAAQDFPADSRPTGNSHDHEKWLDAHRAELRYDPDAGNFRIRPHK
jgi:hypothetical protein